MPRQRRLPDLLLLYQDAFRQHLEIERELVGLGDASKIPTLLTSYREVHKRMLDVEHQILAIEDDVIEETSSYGSGVGRCTKEAIDALHKTKRPMALREVAETLGLPVEVARGRLYRAISTGLVERVDRDSYVYVGLENVHAKTEQSLRE